MTFSARRVGTASSLVAVLVLGGCSLFTKTVYITPRAPVIPKPMRPELVVVSRSVLISPLEQAVGAGQLRPETLTAVHDLLASTKDLMIYSQQLEASIDEYNAYAVRRNAENPVPTAVDLGTVTPIVKE